MGIERCHIEGDVAAVVALAAVLRIGRAVGLVVELRAFQKGRRIMQFFARLLGLDLCLDVGEGLLLVQLDVRLAHCVV